MPLQSHYAIKQDEYYQNTVRCKMHYPAQQHRWPREKQTLEYKKDGQGMYVMPLLQKVMHNNLILQRSYKAYSDDRDQL